MRAVMTCRQAGSVRWRWTEVPQPALEPHDALIRVDAAALNRADALMRTGDYIPSDASWRVAGDRVGFELAGTVVDVGSAAGGVELGAAVMTQAGGACAELVAVDAGLLLPVRGLAPVTAAALPSGLLTEFDALDQAGFVAGDDVLITGASSGVGGIGVQLARALGAGRVTATTRSATAAAELRRLGADLVIETNAESVAEGLARGGAVAARVVLDHVGGEILAQTLACAPPGARVVQIGRLGGRSPRSTSSDWPPDD
jgi:NADPH:quinone reductase